MAEREKGRKRKRKKNNIFQMHHNTKVKNAKTGATIFKTQKKQNKTRKNKCKTCPTNKGSIENRIMGEEKKKESLTEVYKDSKNCE